MAARDRIDRHLRSHPHVYRDRSFVYDECFFYPSGSDAYEGGCRIKVNGTNADVVSRSVEDSNELGVLEAQTGSQGLAAAARAGISGNLNEVLLGASTIKYNVRIKASHVATNPEDFTIISGLAADVNDNGTTNGYQSTSGIYIKFSQNAQDVIKGVIYAGGSETASRTFFSTQSGYATQWHHYGFTYTYNSGSPTVQFYLDGAPFGTLITGVSMPTAALGLVPMNIKKHNGTTSRSVIMDYYSYEFIYDTSR